MARDPMVALARRLEAAFVQADLATDGEGATFQQLGITASMVVYELLGQDPDVDGF